MDKNKKPEQLDRVELRPTQLSTSDKVKWAIEQCKINIKKKEGDG